MENTGSTSENSKQTEVTYSGTIEDQFRTAAEAHRRLDNIAGSTLDAATGFATRTMDSWSSGGMMNGTEEQGAIAWRLLT